MKMLKLQCLASPNEQREKKSIPTFHVCHTLLLHVAFDVCHIFFLFDVSDSTSNFALFFLPFLSFIPCRLPPPPLHSSRFSFPLLLVSCRDHDGATKGRLSHPSATSQPRLPLCSTAAAMMHTRRSPLVLTPFPRLLPLLHLLSHPTLHYTHRSSIETTLHMYNIKKGISPS